MPRLLACLFLFATLAKGVAAKPNIVLIVADDLGINDLSCYGRKDQPTPMLDRLAAEGIRFTSAYAAAPLGAASRAALLTGKAPARLHLTGEQPVRPDKASQRLLQPPESEALPDSEITLAEALQPAGYASACIGIWGLGGEPGAQGFETSYDLPEGAPAKAESAATKGEADLTAKAIAFVEGHQAQPFFLYLSHHSPGAPLAAAPDAIARHAEAFNPTYAAMVETLDRSIGQLAAKLEELHLAENTILIVTSVNGGLHVLDGEGTPATHNSPFRAGKGYLYDGGLRVPMLVRWPGHAAAGSVQANPVSLGSLMATLLEWAGAARVEPLDFSSFASLLPDPNKPVLAELYWHLPRYSDQGGRPGGALRLGDWKLVENYENGGAELYDLKADPGEQQDVSLREAARVAEMRGKLATWRIAVGAQENSANTGFDLAWGNEIYRDLDVSRLAPALTAAEARPRLLAWRAALDRPARPSSSARVAPGFLILAARDAVVHGDALRYEAQPQKNTLGFWKYAGDTASWTVPIPVGGRYAVEALIGCGQGSGGAAVEIQAGGQPLAFKVDETGHFQNFVPRAIGTLRLAAGANTINVVPRSKPGAAVMDLRQLTLTKISD